jgi:predicted O-methyltransferase YrrM
VAARCGSTKGPNHQTVGVTAGGSSIPEVQRLVAALVAAKPTGRIAEIGTAFGAGASAIAAALAPDASFITVEPDEERYRQARETLAGSRAELVNARWEDVLLERGPFDLIFFDGGLTRAGLIEAIELLAPGGILVKDDLTPGRPIEGDPVREALLCDERLVAAEVMTTPSSAAIIAVRCS